MSSRCQQCSKKSHILLPCKCENQYCIKHIQAEKHNCTYNYKESGKSQLNTQLIKCEPSKVDKI
jgi:hypothetical protein